MRDLLGPLLVGIDHVGVAVPDLDEAIAFYRDVLGFELRHTETNEGQGVREAMMWAPGDEGNGSAVQLLAPLGPDTAVGKHLERRGPGLQQVAVRVTDIVAAMDTLRAKGLRLLYESARRGTENSLMNFVHPKDAGGVLIELVQPTGGH
jgi:methylmalonyl-CoA/ethylmalonyl-CoA epimerase